MKSHPLWLALPFVLFGCSDDVNSSSTTCQPGETLNPITGQCVPRMSNLPPDVDAGEDTQTNPDQSTNPDMVVVEDMPEDMEPLPTDCTGNDRRCNGTAVEQCVNNVYTVTQNCASQGLICNLGNCIPDQTSCEPGESRCTGPTSFQNCQPDGMTWTTSQLCPANRTCEAGQCVSGCAGLLDEKSNVGCEYVSMRHNQLSGLRTLPHSVVVSNPGDQPVTIQVSSPAGINPNIPQQTVQPLSSAVLNFPTSPMVSTNGYTSNYYIIRSDRPVIATQFAPLNNPGIGSETSDASLLLPTNAVGREYVVVGWAAGPGGTYVDIVALEPGTVVQVSSPVPLSGGSAGSVAANSTTSFAIPTQTVLHLSENRGFLSQGTRDLSGVVITSNNPVAVYTGANLINIPSEPVRLNPPAGCAVSNTSCATNDSCCSGICGYDTQNGTFACMDSLSAGDHVEQQLFPVETWGTTYVATPFRSRGVNDFTIYRVVAARDNTSITLSPPVNGVSNFNLNRGQVRQIYGPTAFELSATQPVSVGQFMIGGSTSSSGDGDPAFLLPPAVQQFRDSYVFLVPGNYDKNYVTLIKRPASQITVDGNVIPQSQFQSAGGPLGWEYAILSNISAGVHRATSDQTFGVVVHGMDEYISYAFAGGVTLPE